MIENCHYKNRDERHRSGNSIRITIPGLLLSVPPLLGGCVERKIDGDVILFEHLWRRFPVFLLVGAIGTIGGLAALRGSRGPRIRRIAWAGVVTGPIIVFLVAPSVRAPPMVLDASGFRLQTGLWFAPERRELMFDATRVIEISSSRFIGSKITET